MLSKCYLALLLLLTYGSSIIIIILKLLGMDTAMLMYHSLPLSLFLTIPIYRYNHVPFSES